MAVPSHSFPQYLLEGLTSLQESAGLIESRARQFMRELAAEDESEAQDAALSEINDLRKYARWVEGAAERAVTILDAHNTQYARQGRLVDTNKKGAK